MRVLVFTVDLDRDCNTFVPGEKAACSRRRGEKVPKTYQSSSCGMELLGDALRGIGVRPTVFAEAETLRNLHSKDLLDDMEVACHGVEHEDLTGGNSGLVLEDGELEGIIALSIDEVSRFSGRTPRGFRAPYLNVDARVLDHVAAAGLGYDSSMTMEVEEGSLHPWRLPQGIWEFPLARDTDDNGRMMDSYLWAMHEGRRPEGDYVRMLDRFQDGVLVIATHSWHLMESVRDGSKSVRRSQDELDSVIAIIGHAQDSGFQIMALDEAEEMVNADL